MDTTFNKICSKLYNFQHSKQIIDRGIKQRSIAYVHDYVAPVQIETLHRRRDGLNNSIKLFHRNQAYAFIYISIWQKLQATLNIRSTYRKDRAVFDASVCILNVQVLEYTKRQTTLAARQV